MPTDPWQDATAQEFFPIRTVSTLTGVNPITLRAWERRHGLIRPTRTATGHRVYTRADIDTVRRILALVDSGVTISHVREALAAQARAPFSPAADDGPWVRARAQMVDAISRFDEARLETLYNELLALHSIEEVTARLLLPLLVDLGQRWDNNHPGGIAEEHFFGMYMRIKLGARLHHRSRAVVGPKLVAACLPGEHHEIGLLLFALAAHEQGYRMVLLGANMPLEQLNYAARRTQAAGIVLSGSIEAPRALHVEALPALVRDAAVPVFVGGPTSVHQEHELRAAGAIPLGTDITHGLRKLHLTLNPSE
ncbi:MerR family transcriptional regulator [Hylemonella gracilis str. Niagara R]|uniref:MerR family transcriptional regulator n=1 Tax=Hylemonella gracilis str. Niagara R TaxID=1458275 RepID=A0A016XI97_9BURK|nr:MerR family transcriptional regulator [Hylemonella gracilis]EYC50943.1 MerR family transcriptional regulator [Hylemonella gracilis str. Niagara R]